MYRMYMKGYTPDLYLDKDPDSEKNHDEEISLELEDSFSSMLQVSHLKS